MRSIILDTMGNEFIRKDIYYMAFPPEQIQWLNCELDQLHTCVQLIRELISARFENEKYHLIVLVDEDRFVDSEYADFRMKLQKIISVWLVDQLLQHLDQVGMEPAYVTQIFIFGRHKDKATSSKYLWQNILKISEDTPGIAKLPYRGSDGREHTLEMTFLSGMDKDDIGGVAGVNLDAEHLEGRIPFDFSEGEVENRLEEPGPKEFAKSRTSGREAELRKSLRIETAIEEKQKYKSSRDANSIINIENAELYSESREAMLMNLHINIARLVENAFKCEAQNKGVIRWYTTEELSSLLKCAYDSIQDALTDSHSKPVYFDLSPSFDRKESIDELEKRLYQKIKAASKDSPEMAVVASELQQATEIRTVTPSQSEDDVMKTSENNFTRSEKRDPHNFRRSFLESYRAIHKLISEEKELRRKISDICADTYTQWRNNLRNQERREGITPTKTQRPVMKKKLSEVFPGGADKESGEFIAAGEDFSEIRQAAKNLKEEFSKLTAFWLPGNGNRRRQRFLLISLLSAGIVAIIFALMLFLVRPRNVASSLEGETYFLLCVGVFILIYLAGCFLWVWSLRRDLSGLERQLTQLIVDGESKKNKSIRAVIRTYTDNLSGALVDNVVQEELVSIDRKNQEAQNKFNLHIKVLNDALNEISAVRTSLNVPEIPRSLIMPSRKSIDFSAAPYDSANREFYMFFGERGGTEHVD